MKVLFLTTATGQGHNAAAQAISRRLRARGCETVIGDILKSGRRDVSAHVSGTYNTLVTHARGFFGFLYRLGTLVSSSRVHSPIYWLNSLYADSFQRRLEQIAPDAVVCTHIFSAQALTYLREHGRSRLPAMAVITDYDWSPFWEETRLDRYILPAPELTGDFVRRGVPAEKLEPLGIPVSVSPEEREEPAAARAALGLPEKGTVFLCMGGSMGSGDLARVCAVLRGLRPDAQVLAVCGVNRKLFEKVSCLPGVKAYPYTREAGRMMDAADVLITKPGGLTITEAAVRGVPMVLTCPLPSGELDNAAFFSRLGMALYCPKPAEAARAACRLAADPERQAGMRRAQRRHVPPHAAERIADELVALVRGRGK